MQTSRLTASPLLATAALLVGALSCAHRPSVTGPVGVEWPREYRIPASEKAEILQLALLMGVSSPEKVSAGVVPILGDRFLTVHGRTRVDGHRRTQRQANIFRENWRGPDDAPPPELRKHHVGRWISMGDGKEIVTSTVTGGGRTVDVSNMLPVTMDDAERIVAAIIGGTFVDGTGVPEVTTRALAGLTSGRRVSVQSFDEASSSVQWYTGDYYGTILKVRFVDGVVTILEVLQFMV